MDVCKVCLLANVKVGVCVLQAARNAFKGEESLEQLESDWAGLNLQIVLAQTLYAIQPLNIPQHYLDMVPNCKSHPLG